MKPEV